MVSPGGTKVLTATAPLGGSPGLYANFVTISFGMNLVLGYIFSKPSSRCLYNINFRKGLLPLFDCLQLL